MAFSVMGVNALDVLMGDKAILTDTKGRKWTFTYESEVLDEAGHVQLINLKSDIIDIADNALIVDFVGESVYYRDTFGHLTTCPINLHNQGAMFTIRWDSEESGKMDESGNNDIDTIREVLLDWNMSEDPTVIARINLITDNLVKIR